MGAFKLILKHRVAYGRDETDVTLVCHPITHASGVLSIIALLAGSTCVIASPFLSFEECVDVVRKYKVRYVIREHYFALHDYHSMVILEASVGVNKSFCKRRMKY